MKALAKKLYREWKLLTTRFVLRVTHFVLRTHLAVANARIAWLSTRGAPDLLLRAKFVWLTAEVSWLKTPAHIRIVNQMREATARRLVENIPDLHF